MRCFSLIRKGEGPASGPPPLVAVLPGRPRLGGRRTARLLAAAVLLLAPHALAAQGQPPTLALDADEAVWSEPLGFTVTAFGCDPQIGTPARAPLIVDNRVALVVPLTDSCANGQTAGHTARLRGSLAGFAPGRYQVVLDDGSAQPPSVPLDLYFPGDTVLILPEVATSADPAPIQLALDSSCSSIGLQVDGAVIRITIGGCPFEPPPPKPTTFGLSTGPFAPGTYSVRVYQSSWEGNELVTGTLVVRDPSRCLPSDARLCLQDGRFAVTGTWRAFDGSTGVAHATPLAGNEETGLLWFFEPANAEMTLKILDGCGVNQRWWAFLSASSNVEYTVTVTDTVTQRSKQYTNALGTDPALVDDTDLEACP